MTLSSPPAPSPGPSGPSIRPGAFHPLGAHVIGDGVQFSLFSRHATHVRLCLFGDDPAHPLAEIALDPDAHRQGDVWSVIVENIGPGQRYAYRVDGPKGPGLRFDPERLLIDPYARAITGNVAEGTARCIVVEDLHPTAGGRVTPRNGPRRRQDAIIYEVHVKAFTAHESAGAANGGTYRAFIHKIPYLKELGITAVEFLPVHHCGEREIPGRVNPETGEPLTNLWGYQPIGFFAVDEWYAETRGAGRQAAEFRELVDALHAADIDVYVDVVFNHTAEHGDDGPTLAFRGIDNAVYYHLDGAGKPRDLTGCGNTLNCGHPVVSDLIIEALRYWTLDLRVDGFRFDLACVLNRDRHGNLQSPSCLVDRIAEDPILRDVKIVAEPWDLAGGYQVGGFAGGRWAEWNGRYRDDVRRFWRGDPGVKGDFANRLTGSPDLYQGSGRDPQASINFITAHDGFTLRDLVSYTEKRNEANGENNRDGTDHNLSTNCGVEGETEDPIVLMLRLRMQKSCLATLFVSLGIPMLLGGDEFGRTQAGNNNAYCQDNAISWFDWTLVEENAELLRFCRGMIRFRNTHRVLRRTSFFTGRAAAKGLRPDIEWLDPAGRPQEWQGDGLALACRIAPCENDGVGLLMLFNPASVTQRFALPAGEWRLCVNTANPSPRDLFEPGEGPSVKGGGYVQLGQKGVMILTDLSPTTAAS